MTPDERISHLKAVRVICGESNEGLEDTLTFLKLGLLDRTRELERNLKDKDRAFRHALHFIDKRKLKNPHKELCSPILDGMAPAENRSQIEREIAEIIEAKGA